MTPDLDTLKQMFRRAPFVAELGMELESLGDGECATVLRVEPRHLQQTGVVHAGVQATMADHTAAMACSSWNSPMRRTAAACASGGIVRNLSAPHEGCANGRPSRSRSPAALARPAR